MFVFVTAVTHVNSSLYCSIETSHRFIYSYGSFVLLKTEQIVRDLGNTSLLKQARVNMDGESEVS